MNLNTIRQRLGSNEPEIKIKKHHIKASVLIPLVQTSEGLDLLFTVRTEDVEHHRGQVSFPGGAAEPEDEDEFDTALRETREELSLGEDRIEIIGRIDDLATPSGFVVSPVVGYISDLPPLVPQPEEVSEYFFAPLDFFLDDANAYTKEYAREREVIDVWFYDYGQYTIWGITAEIVRNFKHILHE